MELFSFIGFMRFFTFNKNNCEMETTFATDGISLGEQNIYNFLQRKDDIVLFHFFDSNDSYQVTEECVLIL